MKILYLNPPFLNRYSRPQRSPAVTKSGTLYYPIWLAYAAGVAEAAGHEIKLIDACADGLSCEETLGRIRNFSPRLVIEDTSTPSIYNDITCAQDIKRALPGACVALVGTHVSALPEETLLAAPGIDVVIRGEYDYTVLDIASCLERSGPLDGIHGITFRRNNQIVHTRQRAGAVDMDAIPFVSKVYKKHLNMRNYFFAASLYPEVQILTARGCPFRCFFCLWPQVFQGRAWRARSPQNVVEEMRYIQNELPQVKGVVIEDDTFTVDLKRTAHLCTLLTDNKITVPWNANVRTDLDLETMRLMKRSGCYLLIVGIESGSQAILDTIDKGLRTEHIQRFFDNAKAARLLVHAAFMAGNPGETKDTLKENLRLAKQYLPDTVQFFPLMPYPGTSAYAWAKEKGYLKIKSYRDYLTPQGLHNCVIDLPGLTAQELVAWCNAARSAFYLSPRYLWYKTSRIVRRPTEAIRTYKALRTFRKYILKKS